MLSFLYVYSDHSILECYNLFSGVELSMRSFFVIYRGFDKIKQDGRVMVLDEKSTEKLYSRLRLVESDEGTYKIAFENESGTYKDILSFTNRWLVPYENLGIFGKKFMKDIGFYADKPKSGTKSKIPKKRME